MMQVNFVDLYTSKILSGLHDEYLCTTKHYETYENKLMTDMEVVRRVNKMIKETNDFLPYRPRYGDINQIK